MRLQLTKKWFPLEEIDEAIPQLEKSGYLDDSVYARSYLNSEVVRKGKPLLLIKQKLINKWVDKSLLLDLIKEMEEEMQEWQSWKIVKEILRLRWKGKSDPEIVQTLVRKGFAYDSIKKAIVNNN
jgi:regulatory protein